MSRIQILLGDWSLASYPTGGGHWVMYLQYLLGLKALGHDVLLLELLYSTGDADQDQPRIDSFFKRMSEYELSENCVILLFNRDKNEPDFDSATTYGMSREETRERIERADILWNFCCHLRQPLLKMFKRRALIDLDPGVIQVSALKAKIDLFDHHVFLSVGKKIHDRDCDVPALGLKWHSFTPFVYLPMWKVSPDPGPDAPFSSVTKWGWGSQKLNGRPLSTSKGKAYLNYVELPQRTGRSFELAANIHPDGPSADQTGVTQRMESHGWKLVDPQKVVDSPSAYQSYIARSRAEILCPKPIFRELRTGWFSDRSVCYLASGRPVLAEDTGFSDYLPIGKGLLAFKNYSEAESGVANIDSDYGTHTRAARELAEEYFDSQKCLTKMLDASL